MYAFKVFNILKSTDKRYIYMYVFNICVCMCVKLKESKGLYNRFGRMKEMIEMV